MFGYNNDRLFPKKYTVKDHISNTKLEKGDHYYIQTWVQVELIDAQQKQRNRTICVVRLYI